MEEIGVTKQDFVFEKGNNNILISAPHAKFHVREGNIKALETNTKTLIKELKTLTNCHIVYLNNDVDYDPNYTNNNKYLLEIIKYAKENNIKYLIDIHGMKNRDNINLEIGTNYLSNLNNDEYLFNKILGIFENELQYVKVDNNFFASDKTISTIVNKALGIPTLQLEFSLNYRTEQLNKSIKSIIKLIEFLESI